MGQRIRKRKYKTNGGNGKTLVKKNYSYIGSNNYINGVELPHSDTINNYQPPKQKTVVTTSKKPPIRVRGD